MYSEQGPLRQPRKDCKYSGQERKVIEPYKDDFISQTTKAGRLQILRTQILPAIFNYWVNNDNSPTDDEESRVRAKELTIWLSNNWRPKRTLARKSGNFRVKRSEVVWIMRREEVFEEIATMLGVEQADVTTSGWFSKRLPAVARILERMTPADKAVVDAEVQRINKEGYPEDVKRRLADKHSHSRVAECARNQWLEMGVMSVTFTAYIAPDGKLVVDGHDDIRGMLGVAASSFIDTYKDEVKQMKRHLLDYVKVLQTVGHPDLPGIAGTTATTHKIALKMTSDGFPILPTPWRPEDHKKQDLEDLLQLYVAQHYNLATNGRVTHPPFKRLGQDTAAFLGPEYLPTNIAIKNPRNMHKEDIQRFLQHVTERQDRHGPHSAFRFKAVLIGKDMVAPLYQGVGVGVGQMATVTAQVNMPAGRGHDDNAEHRHSAETSATTGGKARPKKKRTGGLPATETLGVSGGPKPADPTVQHHAVSASTTMADIVIIDQIMMDELRKAGMPTMSPINGPQDGAPQYHLDALVYGCFQRLSQAMQETRATTADAVIDPQLLALSHFGAPPTPAPTTPARSPAATPGPTVEPATNRHQHHTRSRVQAPATSTSQGDSTTTRQRPAAADQSPKPQRQRRSTRKTPGNKQ